MRGIINYFLNNTVAANLLMVFIFIMGIFGLLQLKTTFFPEQPSRIINIQLVYPGASPEEIEEGVVTKIEEKLIGVTGVKRTTSTSSENAGNIFVEVDRNFDPDIVLQDVKNSVDQISSFPRQLEPPVVFKNTQLSDAYIFSLSGKMDLKELKRIARIVEDDLLAIDGISRLQVSGFPEEEIEIAFREADMLSMGITFDEAVNAVAQTNLLSTGGIIKTEAEEFLIRAKNKNYYSDSFKEVIVKNSPSGGLVRLHQIADVLDKWEDSPSRTYVDAIPAVVITVHNTLEEDMFDNSQAAQDYLEDLKKRYPDLTITQIRDGKKYLNGRISFIKKNGLIGFFLVLGLLAMFLNVRLAFWVALAIPISFAGMFMAASLLGITINVITTFGMVVVIGILVDDGIVIAENIYQHYERGASPYEAALEGTMEVLPAVSSAILTTVIAFSVFFFIDGFLGDVFKELSIVVIFTLIFSLIEGMFILPAHIAHSKALRANNGNAVTRFFDKVMDFMRKKLYGPILKFSMNFPIPTLAVCIASFMIMAGGFMGGFIKGTFFPFVQSDNFSVSLEMAAGTREAEVYRILQKVEAAAWEVNEELGEEFLGGKEKPILNIKRVVGPNAYEGKLDFYLLDGEKRDQIKNRMITNAIRKKLGPVPEANKLIFGLGNIFGDPVSISLLGANPTELTAAVLELKEELKKISDITDIEDSNKIGLKEVSLNLKPKAQSLGLTLGDIMRTVRQGFFGAEIQRLQRGVDEVKVWIRYKLEDRSSVKDLGDMRIRTASGQAIPLNQLVEFSTERGIVSINHIDGQREIRVSAGVANDKVSISDVNADIQSIILPRVLSKYPSVRVGIEGQARDNAETMASLPAVLGIAGLCMLFVIIITFSSVSQGLIVFMLLPFGLVGVGFGHWFLDLPVSLLSFLGVIALVGIFVNDALVFISTFNQKIKEGNTFTTSLYETGISRFRPITLTTVTTVAGLLPLLLEKSVQAQFLIPMAISVAYGLMIGTFFLLVLLPSLLVMANRMRVATTKLWTGQHIEAAHVEPSFPGRKHPWFLTLLLALFTLFILSAIVYGALQVTQNFV